LTGVGGALLRVAGSLTILTTRRVDAFERQGRGTTAAKIAIPRTFRRSAAAIAIASAAAAATAGSAFAAYPPIKPKPPRAKCSISTIVDRRVAMSCNAGKARAGKRCAIKVKKTIVARGRVAKNGRYSARFIVPKLLMRGTTILFMVEGKTVATLRV
jgi:hypothetical protein